MLIPEAAGLILQAGAMAAGVDAEIVYTGLRPGEKLH